MEVYVTLTERSIFMEGFVTCFVLAFVGVALFSQDYHHYWIVHHPEKKYPPDPSAPQDSH